MIDHPQHAVNYYDQTNSLGGGGDSDYSQMDAYREWEGAEKTK